MIDRKKKKELYRVFADVCSNFDDYYYIVESIKSLCTNHDITEEEYDYIQENWDSFVTKYELENEIDRTKSRNNQTASWD